MDIKELKDVAIELMDALKAKGLGEVEIELDDMKLKIKSAPPAPVVAAPAAAVAPAAAPAAASEDEAPAAAEDLPEGTPVRSPLVGTFYSSPSPDAPPFVLVGQKLFGFHGNALLNSLHNYGTVKVIYHCTTLFEKIKKNFLVTFWVNGCKCCKWQLLA